MNSLAHEKSPAHMYRQHIWRQNKKSTCEIWTYHDIQHSSEWFFVAWMKPWYAVTHEKSRKSLCRGAGTS